MIDETTSELDRRSSEEADTRSYLQIIKAAFLDELSIYSEVKKQRLIVQLPMFLVEYKRCSIIEIIRTVKHMLFEAQSTFSEIFALTRLSW